MWSSGRERGLDRELLQSAGGVKWKAVYMNWWSGESFREEVPCEMDFEG